MAQFRYRAQASDGRRHTGQQQADTPRQARQLLRDKGLRVLSLAPLRSWRLGWPAVLGKADLALLTRQLATLIQAAMPLEEALAAVAAHAAKPRLVGLVHALRKHILEGHSLAQALALYPRAFPELFRATVAAGERSGHLGAVLEQLADYTQARQAAAQRLQMALVYPLILLLASVAIVTFLLGYVVPDVVAMFVDSGQALPLLTEALIAVSGALRRHGWLLPIVAGLAVLASAAALRKPRVRQGWHAWLLRLPVLGSTVRAVEAARFASTLSIMGRSAVPLLDALHIAASVVGNLAIRARLHRVAQAVSEGASLTQALTSSGDIPPMMLHMIASGERVGELDHMLQRAADQQEKTLAAQIALLVSLFEPLMLVVMGGVVLLIVMAILLPILSLNQLVN